MTFEIVTDTSANLPNAVIEQHRLCVIPFTFIVNGRERTCLEAENFDGEGYYDEIRAGAHVTTSQITPGRYIDYMEPLLQQGKDILYVGMSSGISGAYASAEIAAGQLREKYPQRRIRTVDTLAASLGEGIQVINAAEMRMRGCTLDETADILTERRKRMYQIFTVDDLGYLRKGGRVSRAAAIVGSVLQIKPLLKGDEEGRIVLSGKVRGRKASIKALAARYAALVKDPGSQTVGIAHAGCVEDARRLAELLRESGAPADIMLVCYEPVTGAHVGPGTVALFFEGGGDVRSR